VRQAMWTAMAAAALAGSPAAADIPTEISDNRVAVETAWSVFVGDDPKECWVVSAPQNWSATRGGRDVTSSAIRGEIGLYVTFRPADNVAGEVSFGAGYPLEENSQVTVEVGDKTYTLFAIEDWAWPAAEQDAALVADLKAGAEAVVTGVSARGTTTVDTFSLIGITAAIEEALAVDIPQGGARFFGHDQSGKGLSRPVGRAVRDRRARGGAPPDLGRRHAQIPDADRGRPRGGGRLYPRGGSRHAVHLVAGRLHADLFVLPYRHAEAGAQPDRGEIVGQIMVARDDLGEWPRARRVAGTSVRG
jgi:hypothetical protein